MLGYDQIKDLAKTYNARVPDFFCLGPENDPYYMVGNPHAIAQGEWFAGIYHQYWHTLADKIVRSLHYCIIHREVYLSDGKTRYINIDKHYEKLMDAAKAARYLKLVPMDVIEERKNKPDVFIPFPMPHPQLGIEIERHYGIDLYSFPKKPHYTLTSYPYNQRYHNEIWCEKPYSPLRDLALKYGAVWQQGQGEQTVECALMLTERRRLYKRPVRIFYIADYDPSGTNMPIAVARKLEFLLEDIRGNGDEPDVKLYRLVLTQEQIDRYHLPRTPLKDTEKRKDIWEAIHGVDAVELNAIEAQPEYKGELVRIVEEALLRYYDPDIQSCARREELKFAEKLQGIQQEIYSRFPQVSILKAQYNALVTEVEPKLKKLNAEIEKVWQQINEEIGINMPDFQAYLEVNPLPEPKMAEELLEEPLYDSRRDYFSQLAVYKQHQGKRIVF